MARLALALLLVAAHAADALSITHLIREHFNKAATLTADDRSVMQPAAPSAADLARAGPVSLSTTDLEAEKVRLWARKAITQLTPDSELGRMLHEKGIDTVASVLAHMYIEEERKGTLDQKPDLNNWRSSPKAVHAASEHRAALQLDSSTTAATADQFPVDVDKVRAWGMAQVKTMTPEMTKILNEKGPDALADLLTSMYLEEEARNGSAALATAVSQKTTVSTAAPNTTTVVADAAPTAQKLAANDTVANADAPAALVVAPVVPNTTTVVTDVALKAQKLAANGTVANAAAAATPSETTRTADSSIANATVAALATAAAEPKLAVKESNTTADTAHTLPSHDTAAATDPAQTASSAASTAATASDAPAVAPAAATAAPTTMAAVATPAAATATATGAIVPSAAAGSPSKAQQ